MPDPVEPTYDPPLTRCPLCGSERLQPFDRDFRGHKIDRCYGCGIGVMNPQYSDAWLTHFYAGYINGHEAPKGPLRWRSQADVRVAGKTRSLELLESLGAGPGHGAPRILMVGCGDGLELKIAKDRGWQPEGYDVDRDTTQEVADKVGVEIHCGDFAEAAKGMEGFDAMFLDQVIEHPKDPSLYLRTAARILRPGGLLYLGQPNIGSLANRMKTLMGRLGLKRKKRGKHYATKHHIFFYSPRTLGRLLERHYGFEVVKVCGSLKPGKRAWWGRMTRPFPLLDSSFVLVARRPRQGSEDASAQAPATPLGQTG